MQNFDQIFLQSVAAAQVNNVGTFKAFNCTVIHIGSGTWEIILNEPLPYGTYAALATPTTGAFTAAILEDGDATHKFLSTFLTDGTDTLADVNCSLVFFALPV